MLVHVVLHGRNFGIADLQDDLAFTAKSHGNSISLNETKALMPFCSVVSNRTTIVPM